MPSFIERSKHLYDTVLSQHVRRTPLYRSRYLSDICGRNIYLKLEVLQDTGSFKLRGAISAAAAASSSNGDRTQEGFVTASGGNHGLGVARAAQLLGAPAHVFLHARVPQTKVDAIAALGATVHRVGSFWDESNDAAMAFARQHGMVYIHPFDDDRVILGQSTVAHEIVMDMEQDGKVAIDAVVASVGGGGLISGLASYMAEYSPDVQVFGVETFGADSMFHAWHAKRIVELDTITSICEGLGAKKVSQRTLDIALEHVKDCFRVTDEQALSSMRDILKHEKVLTEPSCSCSIAALDQIVEKYPNAQNIVVVLCGGNVALDMLQ